MYPPPCMKNTTAIFSFGCKSNSRSKEMRKKYGFRFVFFAWVQRLIVRFYQFHSLGVYTFRNKQFSSPQNSDKPNVVCKHFAPNWVAFRTPGHGSIGCGAWKQIFAFHHSRNEFRSPHQIRNHHIYSYHEASKENTQQKKNARKIVTTKLINHILEIAMVQPAASHMAHLGMRKIYAYPRALLQCDQPNHRFSFSQLMTHQNRCRHWMVHN